MSNTVTLEFAGDAKKLAAAGKEAQSANMGVGDSATKASGEMVKAGKGTESYTDKIGKLGAGVEGMSGAFDSAGAAVSAMVDLQNAGRERAMRLARAQADVEQAMIDGRAAAVDLKQAQEDLNQSELDGKQAAIDLEQSEIDARQAKLDATTAQKAYNDAVKEHGAGSAEAMQAQIDLTQASADLTQARLDEEQAAADARQATIDGSAAQVDAAQYARDGKDAQLDLNDALSAANPSGLAKFSDSLNMITPILSGLVGIVGLVTAAQWLWNTSLLASPVTWIVLGIIALIAIVVLLVKNWDWVKEKGAQAWDKIKDAASSTWEFLKKIPGWLGDRFKDLANVLTLPFRIAFNAIAKLWNSTIGSLSWSVPGWVPVIGGNTISVPKLPTFHQGGTVPGPPGQEVLAMLSGGETVTSNAGQVGAGNGRWVPVDLGPLGEALLPIIAAAVEGRGGSVTALGVQVT